MPPNPIIAIKIKKNRKDGDIKYNIKPKTPTAQQQSKIKIRPNLSANLPEKNYEIASPKNAKILFK